jgi:hypothetical protein
VSCRAENKGNTTAVKVTQQQSAPHLHNLTKYEAVDIDIDAQVEQRTKRNAGTVHGIRGSRGWRTHLFSFPFDLNFLQKEIFFAS